MLSHIGLGLMARARGLAAIAAQTIMALKPAVESDTQLRSSSKPYVMCFEWLLAKA